jgi:hypothetical protein
MAAYSELQEAEFAAEAAGYTAARRQREVGVGYFDAVAMAISGGRASTAALSGITEEAQFHDTSSASPPTHGHDDGLVHNHDWAVHDWAGARLGRRTTGPAHDWTGARPGRRGEIRRIVDHRDLTADTRWMGHKICPTTS